jgi:hypothetical protein
MSMKMIVYVKFEPGITDRFSKYERRWKKEEEKKEQSLLLVFCFVCVCVVLCCLTSSCLSSLFLLSNPIILCRNIKNYFKVIPLQKLTASASDLKIRSSGLIPIPFTYCFMRFPFSESSFKK